jgi:tripartite-type tricarboxylate transporter receptor subunit TctC
MQQVSGLFAAIAIAVSMIAGPAFGQDFPKKQPIKIVVPVPAGGGTDVMARITAEFLARRLGQTIVVENKPGASSTIGADFVAKSPPDGYTLLFTGGEFAVVPALRSNLPYKYDEMTFLVRPFVVEPLMIASPKFGPSTLQELAAHMKAHPGQVKYGSTGIGAIVHIGLAMFEGAIGSKGLHVPYSGISPVYNDLLGGNIDISQSGPPVPEGIKVLGSVGSKRSAVYPHLPTLEEVGIKGATWDVWFGIMGPPNLPKPVADRLIAEIGAVMKDPEAIAKFQSTAKRLPETEPLTGDAFRRFVIEDSRKWKVVAEREKIVLQ